MLLLWGLSSGTHCTLSAGTRRQTEQQDCGRHLGGLHAGKSVCVMVSVLRSPFQGVLSCHRETEPDWPEEIAGDVKAECGKYGMVSHLHVDKDSKVG